jgi:hypothetical protein
MTHLVEYIRLFQKPATASSPTKNLEMNEENPIEVQILLSAKKLSLFFTAKSAAFVVASIDSFRLDVQNRQARFKRPFIVHFTKSKLQESIEKHERLRDRTRNEPA